MEETGSRQMPTDAELLRRSRRSAEAFRLLYDRHAAVIHGFLARRTRDDSVALELTAETFAAAWLARSRFEDRVGGSAAPWLFGIARHVLAQSVRRSAVERRARERLGVTAPIDATHAAPDESALDGLDEDIEAALAELGEDQRRAVELRVLDELAYDEVGRRLGISAGAARVRVSRGLARLRRHLTTAPSGGSQ
jgi:RNA polymerase sigma factor (sigma-70 family)